MTIVVPTPEVSSICIEDSNGTTAVVETNKVSAVQMTTEGPQGPPGVNIPIVTSSPITGSVIYYDNSAAVFRADNEHTIITITDGGNF